MGIYNILSISRKLSGYIKGTLISILKFENRVPVCLLGRIRIIRRYGKITVGKRSSFWPGVKLSVNGEKEKFAVLKIGERCSIGDRTEIHCGEEITIGDDVIISWDCNILDRDYHATDGGIEKRGGIFIGNRVWVGCRAIIMKNVKIGDDSVIAAGSIVLKDIPPNSLAAGVPAKVVKTISGWTKYH
jgi:acetyltransferase-like isoleucine patch superfamily enzyme